ncbi:MAG TPA: hypothetical protein VHJ17_05250 [Thermomonospora sp.]|nr:hypothetical protein [Thermomonospora sp.]
MTGRRDDAGHRGNQPPSRWTSARRTAMLVIAVVTMVAAALCTAPSARSLPPHDAPAADTRQGR